MNEISESPRAGTFGKNEGKILHLGTDMNLKAIEQPTGMTKKPNILVVWTK